MNLSTKVITAYTMKRCSYAGIIRRNTRGQILINSISFQNNSSSPASIAEGKHAILESISTTVDDGTGSVTVDRRARFAFYLNSAVKEALQQNKYSVGKHPGCRKLHPIQMPEDLQAARKVVLQGQSKQHLQEEARSLHNRIRNRKAPLENSVREEKMQEFMADAIRKETVDPNHPAVLEEDRKRLFNQRYKIVNRKIKEQIYNYQALDFSTPNSCLVYMLTRIGGDYAALVKALSQLRAKLPHFVPQTMLDFGSGVGSATWAVDKMWPKLCKEVVNVDISCEMNLLNERLQKGGTLEGKYRYRANSTFFRQYLPASSTIKHDLVVMSRTMFELYNRQTRLRTLDILWKTVTPGGCLLLVEDGNVQACELMLEAREFLLEGVDPTISASKGTIVAPCPHQFVCPLIHKQKKYRICTDSTALHLFDKDLSFLPKETFSYLVVYKPKGNPVEDCDGSHANPWPRVVQPVLKSSHIIVRVCNKYGNLQELAVCKTRHGTLCKQVSKKCQLGDVFPVELLTPDQHVKPEVKVYDQLLQYKTDNNKQLAKFQQNSDIDKPLEVN